MKLSQASAGLTGVGMGLMLGLHYNNAISKSLKSGTGLGSGTFGLGTNSGRVVKSPNNFARQIFDDVSFATEEKLKPEPSKCIIRWNKDGSMK